MKTTLLSFVLLFACSAVLYAEKPRLAVPPVPFSETEIPADAKRAVPTIDPNGVHYGVKSLAIRNHVLLESVVLTFSSYGKTVFNLDVRGVPSVPSWAPYTFKETELDPETGIISRRHDFRLTEKDEGKFTQTVRLREDGKIELDFLWDCDQEVIRDQIITFHLPSASLWGKSWKVEAYRSNYGLIPNEMQTFPNEPRGTNWRSFYGMTRFEFFPDEPKNGFTLEFPEGVNARFDVNEQNCHLVVSAHRPKITVILDPGNCFEMPTDDSIVGGINFTQCNAFHVAQFDPGRNILMNPSFESGSRYWRMPETLTDSDAHSGRFSFQFRNPPKPFEGVFITSVGAVVEPGKPYVLSCWVKSPTGENPGVSVGVRGANEALPPKWNLPATKPFDQWQRVQYTFQTENSSEIRFSISARDQVLLDDIQLEPGTEPTEYAGNPLGLELLTDAPLSPVVDSKKPEQLKNVRLAVRSAATNGSKGEKGTLEVKIHDFFGRETFTGSFPFDLTQATEQFFPLPTEAFLNGTNVVEVTGTVGGQPFHDFLRLVKFPFATNQAKHKNLVAVAYGHNPFAALSERAKELVRASGTGVISAQGDWQRGRMTKEFYDVMAAYGIDEMSQANLTFSKNWKLYLNEKPWEWEGKPIEELEEYSPEFLAWVEQNTYEVAKKNPWVRYWSFHTEPFGHYKTLMAGNCKEYAKLISAFWRGLKRADPELIFCPIGDCNMMLQGRTHVLDFLRTAREMNPEMHFPVVEIHTYRPFPESPDTEKDLLAFMEGLKEIGYPEIKIKPGEGSYYYPMISPKNGIAPWVGVGQKDQYTLIGIPSYDLGWGERIGAAQTMRELFVYFKYADRIIAHTPWSPRMLDSVTPVSWLAANANVMEILGDADFRFDVRFAPGARAYIFEDQQKRPVAVVWNFEERFDRGLTGTKTLTIQWNAERFAPPEFLDLMGNSCQVEESRAASGAVRCTLPLSGFPVFIRTPPGTLDALTEALSQGEVPQASGTLPLDVTMELTDARSAAVKFENPLSRPVEVKVKLGSKEETATQALTLKPQSEGTFSVELAEPVSSKSFQTVRVPCVIEYAGQTFERNFSTRALVVPRVAEGFDWAEIPAVPLREIYKNADFQGICRLAWMEGKLFIRVEITGAPDATPALYFDSFGDARAKFRAGVAGLDHNDFCYELIPGRAVYRKIAADHQLTGGVGTGMVSDVEEPNIPFTHEIKDGTAIFTVTFPARYIEPIVLGDSTIKPGFGLFLNRGAQRVSNVPAPFGEARPNEFPQLIFEPKH